MRGFFSTAASRPGPPRGSLAERLGYGPDSSLLIVSCDDLGSSAPANEAIEQAMREGIATSATLMVPAPCARAAAQRCRDLDIGIHLTLTSEYPTYRWRSLTGAPSLHDAQGYMPRTTEEVLARADLADVERECQAQIEQALEWGVDITHIDSHMDVHEIDRRYFGMYLRLAERYRVPARVRIKGFSAAFSTRRALVRQGILSPDHQLSAPWGDPARPTLMKFIKAAHKGVTQFMVHPAAASDQLFEYDTENADLRVADAECLIDTQVKAALASRGVQLLGFRPLREAMRGGLPS